LVNNGRWLFKINLGGNFQQSCRHIFFTFSIPWRWREQHRGNSARINQLQTCEMLNRFFIWRNYDKMWILSK
jgi:hypothetical protein